MRIFVSSKRPRITRGLLSVYFGLLCIVLLFWHRLLLAKAKGGVFMQNSRVRVLATCALLLALAMVATELRLFRMPQGGSVTLFRMMFLAIPGFFFGIRAGFLTASAYGLLRLVTGTYIIHPAQYLLDYFLAFAFFGTSGFFKGKENGLILGTTLGALFRIGFSTISGYVFFTEFAPEETENLLLWSLGVNIMGIVPELVLILVLLYIPQVSKAIEYLAAKFAVSDTPVTQI